MSLSVFTAILPGERIHIVRSLFTFHSIRSYFEFAVFKVDVVLP